MEFDEINSKYNTEFTNKLLQHKHIFYEIYAACQNKFWLGCGSYLFDGQEYKYCDKMYEKQELLYAKAKGKKHALEIGVYMGHSLLIMLLANPEIKITGIDMSYELPLTAVNVLKKYFNNQITFIHSDSLLALPKIEDKFDFFHIDGHHDNNYISNEFQLIKRLNGNTDNILRIVFDDQCCLPHLQEEIKAKYTVLEKIIPDCAWNNVYYEIQL
jgi:hypothetical protein